MAATQPTIFDAPITHGTHRKNDPHTSVVAARKDRTGIQAEVLEVLHANGRGTLDTVCDTLPHLLRNSVSRRLTDLERNGLIRATTETVMGHYGQPLTVWEITR